MKKIASVVIAVFIIVLSCSSVFAMEVNSDVIKGVQSTLTLWGYDCGTPDGIIGNKTKSAVMEYQEKQGIEATGEIDVALIDRMTAGVPYDVFQSRYNEVISYFSKHPELTTAQSLQWVYLNETDDKYQPNHNLYLYINPNNTDKKMVGNINLTSLEETYKSDMATIETMAAIYAFDPAYQTLDEAVDDIYDIIANTGKHSIHGITYSNYSFDHTLVLIGMYDNFKDSMYAAQSEAIETESTIDDSALKGYVKFPETTDGDIEADSKAINDDKGAETSSVGIEDGQQETVDETVSASGQSENDQEKDEGGSDTNSAETSISFDASSYSMGFVDYTEFEKYWYNGVFRCPDDLPAGKYYQISIYMPFADYSISDKAGDFEWNEYSTFKSFDINEGQFVNVDASSIVVPAETLGNDLTHYGIYEVGKDIPAGEYKLETISDEYHTGLEYTTGIEGGYQVTSGAPDGNKIEGSIIFGNSLYTEVKQGDYLSIINAKITRAGTNPTADTQQVDIDSVENTTGLIDQIELPIEPLTKEDYVIEMDGSIWDIWDELENKGYMYTYVFYHPGIDENKETVMRTKRGIRLGDSYNKVVATYGEAELQKYDYSHDMVYEDSSYENPENAEMMKQQCASYIKYNVDGAGSIKFLFDDNNELSWVLFMYYQ